jgi:hypothetical protein
MANEATLVVEVEPPINFACADATGIEKGALLKLTSPMTAIISSGAADYLAGIAATEHIANTGEGIGVYRRGIFKMYLSGTASAGMPASAAATNTYPNFVCSSTTMSGTKVLGTFLEDGTNGQTVLVDLNLGASTGAA